MIIEKSGNMNKSDLIQSFNITPTQYIEKKIKESSIVNIYTVSGECIKAKDGRHNFVLDINSYCITLRFDSHITDIMLDNIERIEYYGGVYVRNNVGKVKNK